MTNIQVRLLAAGIALLAGAHAASTDNLDVNVGLVIILVSGVIFPRRVCSFATVGRRRGRRSQLTNRCPLWSVADWLDDDGASFRSAAADLANDLGAVHQDLTKVSEL